MAKRVSLKGKGADLFFGEYDPPSIPVEASADGLEIAPVAPGDTTLPSALPAAPTADASARPAESKQGRRRTTASGVTPNASQQARRRASTFASTLSIPDAEAIDAIRKFVKAPGREVSFVRVTPEEKARVADIVYAYKRRGQKTSENEINRIALNHLLLDYEARGEQSILAQVLAALLA